MDTKTNDLISFELMVYIYCPTVSYLLLDINNNMIPLLSAVHIHATIIQ